MSISCLPRLLTSFSLAALLLAGCGGGDGPELTEVEGTVTLDGKPVPNAQIVFVPTNVERANPSYGLADASGHYKLLFTRDKSGAMIASHKVSITTQKYSAEELEGMRSTGLQVSDVFVPIPKRYRQEVPLTADVKEGPNVIDFPLTSQ